jgi:peptidoglycan/xylan/chitin deacetylase (PgdA/CDA1 family)
MRIPGYRTSLRAAAWASAMLRPGPVILGYHRIADAAWDPNHLCVSPRNFREQLEVLKRVAQPVPLQQVETYLTTGRAPGKTVAVTFDDGYADTCEVALPVLEQREVPVTIFVITGTIGGRYWWEEIQQLVEAATELPARIELSRGGCSLRWKRKADEARNRRTLVRAIGDFFRALPFADQRGALEDLTSLLAATATDDTASQAISAEQVAVLSASELVGIGSHTVTHASLGRVSADQQVYELERSKLTLEAITGQPVETFSYPNGIPSADSPRLARMLGYTVGCTSREGVVSPASSRYLLPRLWVGDWDGERFARWLRRWMR